MKNYFVLIKVELPYPLTFQYTLAGSNPGVAISRAYRKFRAEVPRKKIDVLRVEARLLKKIAI